MAKTLKDEQERLRRINLVGEYFLSNPEASTRNAAKYFLENKILMSNCTISNYLRIYKELHMDRADQIDNKINSNKPMTHENSEVQKRVLFVAEMYLKFNLTEEEIANCIHESVWIVRRDLSNRLEKIDENLYRAYKEKAKCNSLNNIVLKNRK